MINTIDNYCYEQWKEKIMRRRIVIEMDDENSEIFNDILKMIAERTDSNVECTIRQEIIPERISREINIPSFMNFNRLMKEGVQKNG